MGKSFFDKIDDPLEKFFEVRLFSFLQLTSRTCLILAASLLPFGGAQQFVLLGIGTLHTRENISNPIIFFVRVFFFLFPNHSISHPNSQRHLHIRCRCHILCASSASDILHSAFVHPVASYAISSTLRVFFRAE